MERTEDSEESGLADAAKNLEHATDALASAVVCEPLPARIRRALVEALVTVARVSGLVEALDEGIVSLKAK